MSTSEVSDSPPDGRCDTPPVRTTFTELAELAEALANVFPKDCPTRLFDNVGQSFDEERT